MARVDYPGVYLEESSFRAKVIDGVATLLAGFMIGLAAAVAADRLRRRWRRT